MATNISGLFGDITKTPQQYQQEALQGLIVTPAQMGQQGLYQQLVSQMSNAGANIGMGVGGLLGGKTAEQVRGGQINAAMQEVSQGQYATEWEKLDALAKNLAEKGMNAEAEKAAERSAVLKEREFVSGERTRKAAAEEAALVRQKSLVSEIVKQNPELPVAAAQSIASDPKAVRDFFNPQVKKVIRNLEDGVFLLNADTGERIKKVGDAQTDASGLKGLTAQLKAQQLADLQAKAAERGDKAAGAKKQDIARLARNESDAEIAINTGYRAMGLAPTSAGGAFTQAAFDSIPWTDAKSLSNLVESLNNEKAISTLQQLKEQSRTGATGFGALSEKELNLILAKTRKLDPTDKMFKENLKIVLEGWDKIRQESRKARLELQGVEDPLGLR